ncbi:hypothetical protein MPER_12190 [Moniliophthora perniciosa FA553]|nr:hypothetical protein MPER_12190 [Moniliophthora perniciosa FA553]
MYFSSSRSKLIHSQGKSRADLESLLSSADISHDKESRAGEAALYGIYYDDTEYDYMQHLRPIGIQEEGVESVLIEAPQKAKKTQEAKQGAGITLRDDLPAEPDMDPHLRQVLEALEDDAFVDDGLEDDFFVDLVQEGERGCDEEIEFEFREEGVSYRELEGEDAAEKGEPSTWEERFAEFKKAQKEAPSRTS